MMWDTWPPAGWYEEAAFDDACRAFDGPDWAEVMLHSYRHHRGFAAGDPLYDEDEGHLNPAPVLSVPTLVLHGGADLDLFHLQRGEGNLIERMRASLPYAAHVLIADVPGRHDPGTEEINFANVFAALESAQWQGWVGCEYIPAAGTEAGLGWPKTVTR